MQGHEIYEDVAFWKLLEKSCNIFQNHPRVKQI